jgi:hypothetical protein
MYVKNNLLDGFKKNTMLNRTKRRKSYHLLSVVLLVLGWVLSFFLFYLGSHNQPISNISLNKAIQINAIKINGKSFFPLGFYHTSFQLELKKK